MTGILRVPRSAALVAIAVLVAAASVVSFAESYRGLYAWAHEHGLAGPWAVIWPLQVDVFIAVGELALFVALADRWAPRSRLAAWAVTGCGLAVSVAGNIGHVTGHSLADHVTAAVPPLAAAAALAVGLGVLKRVVEAHHTMYGTKSVQAPTAQIAHDAEQAARIALAASVVAGNPLSQRQLMGRFGLTRTVERKVRQAVTAGANGSASPSDAGTDAPPVTAGQRRGISPDPTARKG
jgi:hypothetical protein